MQWLVRPWKSFWLRAVRCGEAVLGWLETHSGLGGWVGAAGAIIAIFVAWGIARDEYLRLQRVEAERVKAEISLIMRTANDFDPLAQQYITLYNANAPEAAGYYNRLRNDYRISRMVDFNTMPVTQWPSVESYDAFKRYFFSSTNLMETSGASPRPPLSVIGDYIKAYDGTLETLRTALTNARR
jgi:hypothetical protein